MYHKKFLDVSYSICGQFFKVSSLLLFLCCTVYKPNSGAHPASYPMCTGVSFRGGKADHSPPSSAAVKNAWSYISTPLCLHVIVKQFIVHFQLEVLDSSPSKVLLRSDFNI
jgi:hypothetical protein